MLQLFLYIVLFALPFFTNHVIYAFPTLNRADVYPMWDTMEPESYLLTGEKLFYKESPWAEGKRNLFTFSISPFAQTADQGKTISGEPSVDNSTNPPTNVPTPLSDIGGRTSLIGLLFGDTPQGATVPASITTAQQSLFPTLTAPINNGAFIDTTNEQFAFESFPFKYRKKGLRFNFVLGWCDFGASIQTGVVSISQSFQPRINRTISPSVFPPDGTPVPQLTDEQVNQFLVDPLNTILEDLGYELEECPHTSIEETRFNLFWRHIFEINQERFDYPFLLLVPYAQAMVSASFGQTIDANELFPIPFGNNKHTAAGFKAGINFDFVYSIEIGGEVSYVHFFKHSFDQVRLPTSEFQSGLFPYSAPATIKPGPSWHFAGKIASYYFLEKLSAYFQYVIVEHKKDTITLETPDPAFNIERAEDLTCFKAKLANFAFNYDISPNMTLGVLWQIPLSQRNVFRSTTVMFSFNATI